MAEDLSKRAVVYALPGMEQVATRRDGDLDIYTRHASTSAVVVVGGYPDAGFERVVGCPFREMGSTVSWCRLIAASGSTAVAYSNRSAGLEDVVTRIRAMGYGRVSLFASSGNAPLALSLLLRDATVRIDSAVLCYPYTFGVPAEAKKFGFATPCNERSTGDLANDIPLLVARAGRDEMPGLNRTLDAFIAVALEANLRITLVNHAEAPHAFDLFDDSETTRDVMTSILAFLNRKAETGRSPVSAKTA